MLDNPVKNTTISQQKVKYSFFVILCSIVLLNIWLISIVQSRSSFLNNRLEDPLAMITSLSHLYYISLIGLMILSITYILYCHRNKYIDIFLLIEFAFILWYTPNYLSGFVYEPPGIYHAGVASNIPHILDGLQFISSNYGADYPGSFIFTFTFLEITGINIPDYVNFVFPTFYIVIFVIIWYTFISKLFNNSTAFISSLVAFSGLHYFKIYPSPQTVGIILIFSCLLLVLAKSDLKSRIMGFFIFMTIPLTHPISPALALILIISYFIFHLPVDMLKISRKKIVIIVGLVFVSSLMLYLSPVLGLITNSLNYFFAALSHSGLILFLNIVLKPQFLYPEIYFINQFIYVAYLLFGLFVLSPLIFSEFKQKKNIWLRSIGILKGLGKKRLFLISACILFMLFGAFVYLIFPAQDLIERSLTFFILMISVLITTSLVTFAHNKKHSNQLPKEINKSLKQRHFNSKKWRLIIISSWVIAITLSFPLISYSIGNYNATPISEDYGMRFLADNVPLDGKKCHMSVMTQLAMYLEPPINVALPQGPLYSINALNDSDVIALRNTGYYYFALRHDLSLEDNRWIRFRINVDASTQFNKIYASQTFSIYLRDAA